MSEIESLSVGLTAKTSLLGKDFEAALSMADKFGQDMTERIRRLEVPAPKFQAPSASGAEGGGQAADLGSSLLPLAGKIQSTIAAAVAPLNGFAARFGAQFDQVGATIIAISNRIDAHLKFPTFQKGIEQARGFIQKNFAEMEGSAKRYAMVADQALGGVQLLSKVRNFAASLGGLNARMGEFGKIKAPNINFDNSSRSITNITNLTKGATSAFKGLGSQIALSLGLFGLAYKAVEFFKSGIKGASDLNESISKTDAVLGDASAGVKRFADDMASRFGLVKGETLDIAAGIGGLAKGLGKLSGANLEKFTTDFTKLAADLSSFKNISFAEAGKALMVGLSGEQSDQLKQLGVVMTEDTVKAYAYANGIAKVGKELTNQEKLTARAGVIQKALADASGDLDRTASGTANQFRKFTGTLENLATSIGTVLLPVINKGLGLLNRFGEWAGKAFEGNKQGIADFFGNIETGLDVVAAGFNHWQAVVEVARLTIVQALANVGEYFETLGPNVATIANYIADNWKELIVDALNATLAALKNLWKNFQSIAQGISDWIANPTGGFEISWTPLLDGFEKTAAKFPELLKPHLTDLSREIGAAAQPILDELKKKADAAKAYAQNQAKAAASVGNEISAQQMEHDKDIATFAKGLKDKIQSPIQKYIAELSKINEAQAKGLINSSEAMRAKLKAGEEAGFGGPPKLSGALEANSTEARSAVLNAMAQRGGKDRVADNTRIIAQQGAQALSYQKQMLGALQPRAVVSIP